MARLIETIIFSFFLIVFVRAFYLCSGEEMPKDTEQNLDREEHILLKKMGLYHQFRFRSNHIYKRDKERNNIYYKEYPGETEYISKEG